MRRAWCVVLGLVATAAACGGSDEGDDDTNTPDTPDASTSSNGGGASSGGSSSSSSSSGSSSSSSSTSSSGSTSSSSGELDGGDSDAGEDDAGEDADAEPDAGPSFQYAKFDLNHLLIAGQSNALGIGGGATLDTTPRGATCSAGAPEQCSGLMFGSGVFPTTNCVHWHEGCTTYEARDALVPLVEGDRYENASSTYQLQTPASSLANQAAELASTVYFPGSSLAESGVRMMVSDDARSGNSYMCIRKGSCPFYFGGPVPATVKTSFEDGINQVQAAKALADARNWSYAVRGVFTVHGEADHDLESNYQQSDFPMTRTSGAGTIQNYKEALLEWQQDYETAIVAQTGQTEPVPMYLSQMTNWTWIRATGINRNIATRSVIPLHQLAAFREQPQKIILVTPTYPFQFNDLAGDKVHFTPTGSRRLGEYFGKAYAYTTFTGQPWKPLHPTEVNRNGATITIKFHVPVAPLRLDTVAVSNPNGMYGFRYADSSATPAVITAVQVQGDNVVLTLDKVPDGGSKRVIYANDGVAGAAAGPTSGPRGNLCDSDATPSRTGGAALVNWSVAFEEAVP